YGKHGPQRPRPNAAPPRRAYGKGKHRWRAPIAIGSAARNFKAVTPRGQRGIAHLTRADIGEFALQIAQTISATYVLGIAKGKRGKLDEHGAVFERSRGLAGDQLLLAAQQRGSKLHRHRSRTGRRRMWFEAGQSAAGSQQHGAIGFSPEAARAGVVPKQAISLGICADPAFGRDHGYATIGARPHATLGVDAEQKHVVAAQALLGAQ